MAAAGLLVVAGTAPFARQANVSAAGPFDIYAGGGTPTSVTWTGGPVVGAVANVGPPPAPVCQPGNCDRTSFTLHAPAGFTTNNKINVTVSITFPAGPTNGQEDVGIINSSNHAVASVVASNTPATITANDIPPGNYVVEVDGDTGDPTATSYQGTLSADSVARIVVNPVQSPTTIAFSTPTVVDPIHPYGEPDIRIDHLGRVFVSGPTGTGTQRSLWSTSLDGGATWRPIAQGPPPTGVAPNPLTQPGGGDTDIAFDRSNKQYFSDLYALACQRVATTTTAGASVMQNPAGCGPGLGGSDRQWLLVYDPPPNTPTTSAYAGGLPLVYNEYNDVATAAPGSTGPSFWSKSVPDAVPGDPGLSYSSARGTPQKTVFGADGYPSIDQVTGKVFQATFFNAHTIKLNIGTPDAAGNLTFLDDMSGGTANLVTVANNIDNNGDVANFVVSSMDDARNLWVAWVGRDNADPSQRQVYAAVASATSNWSAWSQPVRMSAAPSQVNIFPWIKASGTSGIADVVWYGSYIPTSPLSYPDPSTDLGQVWDVYMGQVRFPVDSTGGVLVGTGPVFPPSQTKVSPHHMDYGSACLQGTGCITSQGNRNLADFFEVNLDAHGAAMIVYNDMSNGLIQTTSGFTLNPTPGSQITDHNGAAIVTVARQSAGPGLFGADVPSTYLPNTPLSNGVTFNDPQGAGGAQFPVLPGGPVPSSSVPGMDVLGTTMSLSGGVLTITNKVLDLSNPATTAATVGAANLQYVTRWQMATPGDAVHPYTLYYAMAEYNAPTPACPTGSAVTACFSAGAAQSIDLCSVSACDPHVIVYPESGGGPTNTGVNENGSVVCPATPSVLTPCTITMSVNAADIGSPSSSSLLEEVGTYAFSAARPQAPTTNTQAQADEVPLEVDGLCCFNFQAQQPTPQIPETAWAPALLAVAAAAVVGGLVARRRRRRHPSPS